MSPATAKGRRDARAQAQRDRILDAAQKCFTERGFHGASMSMIAETTDMSPGLIYRYFAGKSELIHGIVSRQIEVMADDLEMFKSGNRDAAAFIVDRFREGTAVCITSASPAQMLEPALVLEIVAESGRDPIIASALDTLDRHIDDALGDWLSRPLAQGGQGVPAQHLPARILILRSLLDGLKMRQARHPDMDPDLLRAALDTALRGLRADH